MGSAGVTLQVPVDRRAGDAELLRDLADVVRLPAVDAHLVVHARGDLRLTGGELELLAARLPTRSGGHEAVAG